MTYLFLYIILIVNSNIALQTDTIPLNLVVHRNACARPCLNVQSKSGQVNVEFWSSILKLSLRLVGFTV